MKLKDSSSHRVHLISCFHFRHLPQFHPVTPPFCSLTCYSHVPPPPPPSLCNAHQLFSVLPPVSFWSCLLYLCISVCSVQVPELSAALLLSSPVFRSFPSLVLSMSMSAFTVPFGGILSVLFPVQPACASLLEWFFVQSFVVSINWTFLFNFQMCLRALGSIHTLTWVLIRSSLNKGQASCEWDWD